jgi:flagellar FliL protein
MVDEKEGSKLKVYLPSARSRLLMLLSNKTAEEVSDDSGKQTLKDELKAALEEPFVTNAEPVKVGEVLFTSFVVQ